MCIIRQKTYGEVFLLLTQLVVINSLQFTNITLTKTLSQSPVPMTMITTVQLIEGSINNSATEENVTMNWRLLRPLTYVCICMFCFWHRAQRWQWWWERWTRQPGWPWTRSGGRRVSAAGIRTPGIALRESQSVINMPICTAELNAQAARPSVYKELKIPHLPSTKTSSHT